MKMKYACGVILLSIVILFTGCSTNYMASIYNNDEKISSNTNSFNLDIEEQNIDGQQFSGILKKMEGMDTIWTYDSEEDKDLDMTYLLDVTTGKLKLVLISPDNSLTTLIETTNQSDVTSYTTNTIQVKKGLNRIKMVAGKNTSAEFDISLPNGEFKELGN